MRTVLTDLWGNEYVVRPDEVKQRRPRKMRFQQKRDVMQELEFKSIASERDLETILEFFNDLFGSLRQGYATRVTFGTYQGAYQVAFWNATDKKPIASLSFTDMNSFVAAIVETEE